MSFIIFSQLKYLIQRVYQLTNGKTHTIMKRKPDFNPIQVDPLRSLKFQSDQPQPIPVWPTMMQPCYVQPFNGFPNLNCKIYIYVYN